MYNSLLFLSITLAVCTTLTSVQYVSLDLKVTFFCHSLSKFLCSCVFVDFCLCFLCPRFLRFLWIPLRRTWRLSLLSLFSKVSLRPRLGRPACLCLPSLFAEVSLPLSPPTSVSFSHFMMTLPRCYPPLSVLDFLFSCVRTNRAGRTLRLRRLASPTDSSFISKGFYLLLPTRTSLLRLLWKQ